MGFANIGLLVKKSLRTHALSTTVTVLSTALASGLVMAVVAVAYLKWRTVVLDENLTHLARRVTEVPGQADLYSGGGRTILQNLMTQTRVFWMYASN